MLSPRRTGLALKPLDRLFSVQPLVGSHSVGLLLPRLAAIGQCDVSFANLVSVLQPLRLVEVGVHREGFDLLRQMGNQQVEVKNPRCLDARLL